MRPYFLTMLFVSLVIANAESQVMSPGFFLEDMAETHNMHICSDGEFYYTINGGDEYKGMITKYDLEGIWVKSFPLRLDARSIMFNPKDKSLYVAAYDRNIYRLTDMQLGAYEIVFKELYANRQSVPALSPDGSQLFVMNDGNVNIYDFNDGSLMTSLSNIKCGEGFKNGSTTIAVDDEYFYTWNSKEKEIFAYDLNGNYAGSIKVAEGAYHFSLSVANQYVFTAFDGEKEEGIWYAYDLKEMIGSKSLLPEITFKSESETHNNKICFDGKNYYTAYGGDVKKSCIQMLSLVGKKIESYPIALDLNGIVYSPKHKTFYVNVYAPEKKRYIYTIEKFKKGKFKALAEGWYDDPASAIAMDPEGRFVYLFSSGRLKTYDLKLKQKIDEINGLKCGTSYESGNAAVAVSEEYIFTWDAERKLVFQYDMKGRLKAKYHLANGDFGPSISYANGMLFVASDGDDANWYGYIIP